jgi:AraC-like DNA-binding protein
MDVLTEVLRDARARTAIYGRLELTAPWGIRVERHRHLAFYAIARGGAVIEVLGKRIRLAAGDLVFLRDGLTHAVKDHPRSRAADVARVYAERHGRCGGTVQYGGGGAPSTLIAGGLIFESTALDPLVAHLPAVIHVAGDAGGVVRWLESTLHLMAFEMRAEEPGYELVASRLADVLFVRALRSHVKDNPCEAGWIRAIGDPQLGAAFQRMHAQPAEPWTVASLARSSSMSRAAFAARFKQMVGVAPLAYLTRWRMCRAMTLLAGSPAVSTIAAIAAEVGYATESAFTKVFKRHVGQTPGAYRRRARDDRLR